MSQETNPLQDIEADKDIEADIEAQSCHATTPSLTPALANPARMKFVPHLADRVLHRIATEPNTSVQKICSTDPEMPIPEVIYGWLTRRPSFQEAFARAREQQAHLISYQAIEIADSPLIGVRTERKRVGWQCSGCGLPARWRAVGFEHMDASPLCDGARHEAVYEQKVVETDNVERSKLMVATRQHLAEKLSPRHYGSRTQLDTRLVDGEGKDRPLTLADYDAMVSQAQGVAAGKVLALEAAEDGV